DPEDVDAALAILRQFICNAAPMGPPPTGGADRTGSWQAWFAAANALMLENPAPATDHRALQRMAPLGLGLPGFDPARFPAEQALQIEAGVADAMALGKGMGFAG